MEIILQIVILVVGFVLLIKGADVFVDGASSVAANFKVSKMLVGLTIVAFGTSAPELAVAISALASGSTDMVIGNVMGSCVLNIFLILGLVAVIRPIKIHESTIKKELPLQLLLATLLAVLILDVMLAGGSTNEVTRSDGIVLVLFFSIFLFYLFSMARSNRGEDRKPEKPKFKLGKSFLWTVLGMAGIVAGSQMVVNSSSEIATAIGWSERLIALTIIALGTSLPELVTSVIAAKKGETDLAIGNIIGSNIFNICLVLGAPVVLFGTVTATSFTMLDVVMMVASAVVLYIFAHSKRTVSRAEGVIMLVIFAAYYTMTLLPS